MADASKHSERQADPAAEGNGHAAPGAPGEVAATAAAAAPAKPEPPKPAKLVRFARNLRAVWVFARRHWVGLVAALALMSVEAVASSGRIFLFYPVMTKVLTVDPSSNDDQSAQVTGMMNKVTKKLGWLMQSYDALIDRMNSVTGPWVSDERIEKSVADVADPAARAKQAEAMRSRHATLISVSFLFIVFIVVMCIAAYLESYVAARVSLMIAMDVRKEVTRKLLDQPVGYFDSVKRGELVGRALGDVEGYYNWLNLLLNTVIKGGVQLLASLVLLMAISGKLTLFCLLGLPFLLPMRNLMKRVLKRSHRRAQETGKRVESLLQIFSGIRTVKAFGTEPERLKDFHHTDEEVTRVSLKVQRAKSHRRRADRVHEQLPGARARGGRRVARAERDARRHARAADHLPLPRGKPLPAREEAGEGLQQHAGHRRERGAHAGAVEPAPPAPRPGGRGGLPRRQARDPLRERELRVRGGSAGAGERVLRDPARRRGGAGGPDGRRQEHAVRPPAALLRPARGPHHDRRHGHPAVPPPVVPEEDRRRGAGAVPLPHDDPREHPPGELHGHRRRDRHRRQGRADPRPHRFAAAGYLEEVGESGVRLSGGQRQRITIARALVRDPSVLVLDEATASLDAASEHAVQVALERLQAGRTTLVVAHRLATVQNATRIVVVAHGRVLDQGTHHELLGRCSLYAELVKMQNLMPAAETTPT